MVRIKRIYTEAVRKTGFVYWLIAYGRVDARRNRRNLMRGEKISPRARGFAHGSATIP